MAFTAVASQGCIEPGVLYRLDEAKARMGWRDAGFRAAIRAGLKVYRAGKRVYILGSDLIEYVTAPENMYPEGIYEERQQKLIREQQLKGMAAVTQIYANIPASAIREAIATRPTQESES